MAPKCTSCSFTDLAALDVLALLTLACAVMAARTAGADMALEANSVGLRLCDNKGPWIMHAKNIAAVCQALAPKPALRFEKVCCVMARNGGCLRMERSDG
jgi:hypothetical protein